MDEEEEQLCPKCWHEIGYHVTTSLYGKQYINCGHVSSLGRVCPCERDLD